MIKIELLVVPIHSTMYILIIVPQNDIQYAGMMFHEKKAATSWTSTYTVVRNLDVLEQVYLF